MAKKSLKRKQAPAGAKRSLSFLSVTDGHIWGCSNAKVLFEECEADMERVMRLVNGLLRSISEKLKNTTPNYN